MDTGTATLHTYPPAGDSRAPRLLRLVLAGLVAIALFGERGAHTQIVNGVALGIDPLRVLDLQVKPNVIFILDTSGSMQENPATNTPQISGDDTAAKMYLAKQALNSVMTANAGKFNFGLASYNLFNSNKILRNPPLMYVTTTSEPGVFVWTGGNSYFSTNLNTPYLFTSAAANPTPADDAQVYRSFLRLATQQPGTGCAAGVNCRLYLRSRLFRTGLKFKWTTTLTAAGGQPANVGTADILTSITPINCANFPPPAGLFPDDPTGMVRPCIQMENSGANLRTATFWWTGGGFTPNGPVCDGAAVLDNVSACGVNNIEQIQKRLQLELPLWDMADPTANTNTCGGARGMPCALQPATVGSTATAINGTNPAATAGLDPNLQGVMAAQNTPLGGSLGDILTSFTTIFPIPGGTLASQQKNFVIFLTDGAETCTTNPVVEASNLWNRNGHVAGQWAETIVIGFSLGASQQLSLNAIACAGSGGTVSNPTCSGSFCTAACTGGARRNAFSAADLPSLIAALQSALSEVTTTGQFAASPSMVASIFEYIGDISGKDPRDPESRYAFDFPLLFQPSFEVPGFKGRLRAFKSDLATPPSAVQVWEAGQKLLDRVVNAAGALGDPVPFTVSPTASKYTFAQLNGGASITNVDTSSARIKRRILSTERNGVNPPSAALWPPDPTVSPAAVPVGVSDPPGSLDAALGVTYPALPDDATRFAQLQSDFGACTGVSLPPDCLDPNPTLRYTEAKREAREMILAWTAGARVVRDDAQVVQRNATSELLFESRSCGDLADPLCGGILGESTNATPAVITQPPDAPPDNDPGEKAAWLLLRDGPRTAAGDAINMVDSGFGLTSPDADGKENPPNPSGTSRPTLKPIMSVAYYGGNDMLHAFRAGLQCTAAVGSSCPGAGDETGGEELWGFVPFDQLPKLAQLMTPRPRDQRIYMIATSLRFTRVFIPGPFVISGVNYTGRWRTVMLFGRGPGGKHYTAMDVTTPGAFTRTSLRAILPTVLWNRGNPDTDDGLPKSASNNFNNPAVAGDATAYAQMGLSFSVPGVGRVQRNPSANTTPRSGPVEFVAYTGSGYSDQAGEGHTLYALDVLTGDVIHSLDVGSATSDPQYPSNAVVAGPSVFIPTQLERLQIGNPYGELATRMFVGDLHGRVWRILTENWNAASAGSPFFSFGPDQPIGVPLALLNYSDPASGDTSNRPYIFGETGNDSRVAPPPSFVLFGLREEDNGSATRAFPDIILPSEATSPTDPTVVYFRGTAQPASAFNTAGNGRVFYIGTVFKPCVDPPFESVLFAVTAATGDAAYDLTTGDDRSIRIPDLVLDKPIVTKDTLVMSRGLAAGNPPPPPGGPSSTNATSGPNARVFLWTDGTGAVTTVRLGSTACR